MNKLIVVTAALASVTLLSGCKHVVVHRAHTPDVVVDTRHHHEYRDVRVIRHEEHYDRHPGRGYGRGEVPPGHEKKRVVVKEKVVVRPPVRDARFHREVERRSTPQKEKQRHEKQSRRQEQHPPRREREHDRRDEGGREARGDERQDHGKKRGKEKEQHARNREERFR